MFVRTGDMDQKVGPWESLKWVTRVRNMQKLRSLQYEEKLFIQSQSHSEREITRGERKKMKDKKEEIREEKRRECDEIIEQKGKGGMR